MLAVLSTDMTNAQQILKRERGLKLKVARALKITHGAVSQWKEIPPLRVLDVERVTGISRHELRPDLYPEPEAA